MLHCLPILPRLMEMWQKRLGYGIAPKSKSTQPRCTSRRNTLYTYIHCAQWVMCFFFAELFLEAARGERNVLSPLTPRESRSLCMCAVAVDDVFSRFKCEESMPSPLFLCSPSNVASTNCTCLSRVLFCELLASLKACLQGRN